MFELILFNGSLLIQLLFLVIVNFTLAITSNAIDHTQFSLAGHQLPQTDKRFPEREKCNEECSDPKPDELDRDPSGKNYC
jgi:hypothetical protein